MRVLAIVHQRDAGPAVFAEAIAARGDDLDVWHRAETDDPPADPARYDAVLTFGGAMHVDQREAHPWLAAETALLRELLEREVPLLGVCLGAQLLSEAGGGTPRRAPDPEIGWFDVEVTPAGAADPVIGPLAPGFCAFEWHSYECGLPPEAVVLACTPVCAQAYRLGDEAWGIQFHAEVGRAEVNGWIGDYLSDPDALALDPERLRARSESRMDAWNQLGRGLCARFLEAADGG